MLPLTDYIYKPILWDSHTHFFDYSTNLDDLYHYPEQYCKLVGFADICLDKLSEYSNHKIIRYYDEFIKNKYDHKKHILLATSDNAYDSIQLYLKYPDIIKGFGEFKCYKTYRGKETQFGNLNWIRPVCEFNKELRLPIYIHWCFKNTNDVLEFESLLKDYNSIPFVLCHCGMGFDNTVNGDSNYAYEQCIKLQQKYKNIYFDVSYKAMDFFAKAPKLLNRINNRVLLGSDLNPQAYRIIDNPNKHKDIIYTKMNSLYSRCFSINTQNIFNLTPNRIIKYELNSYDFIISEYLKNINKLPIEKQQHFVTRLNLLQPMYIKNYMDSVISELHDIIKLYDNKEYREIVMKYVVNPYKTTNDEEMKKVYKWIKSISDESLLKILSVGIYVDKSSIVTRNGFEPPELKFDANQIYNDLTNNSELYSNEGTLYINCAGYIWNLYDIDIELWRKVRNVIVNGKRTLRNIYGVTHILLQASNFYTQLIDNEYDRELNIIYNLLKQYRLNDYKNISIDLLCEMALCLKYSKSNKYHREFELVKKYIDKIILKNQIIFTTKSVGDHIQDLINNEHTNALYILMQKTNRKLFGIH